MRAGPPMTRTRRSAAAGRRPRSPPTTASRSSAPPRGRHGAPDGSDEPPDMRWVVLHMIEETACHAGHLDIARELLDGRTNLGLR